MTDLVVVNRFEFDADDQALIEQWYASAYNLEARSARHKARKFIIEAVASKLVHTADDQAES